MKRLSTAEDAGLSAESHRGPAPLDLRHMWNPINRAVTEGTQRFPRRNRKAIIAVLAVVTVAGAAVAGIRQFATSVDNAWGANYVANVQPASFKGSLQLAAGAGSGLRHWNTIAVNASGFDHTPVAPGEARVFGEQLGPCRAARAMAIVHIATFEAVNAITGGYRSYTGLPRARIGSSMNAAIAQSAHDTLIALFPSQKPSIDQLLADDLSQIPAGQSKLDGISVGRQAARSILALRANDGSQHPEPLVGIDFITSDQPGKWRQDPLSSIPLALGAHWGQVRPFILQNVTKFRVPPPPAINSPEYAAAYNEVKHLGGDGIVTPTIRTPDQTNTGLFWAYDGTPTLCAPPRLYNQLVVHIADQLHTEETKLARLLALVHVALADAGIAVWESKYFYQYWRPVTGIREADPGTGPTGLGDGNPATTGDPTCSPLGAPASNLIGPNFTPPFPAYPSGHAGFGGALFQVLRKFYGTDNIPFTFVSDELNGVTVDNVGSIRPLLPRSFTSFSQAEEENGQSRIYLGIHWSFDKTQAIAQGRRVGNEVFSKLYTPASQK